MKRNFFVTLSLIYIFNNNALYGMIANKARRSFSYKTVQQPKTVKYTNPYRKPILFDRVKQYYNQMKQGFSQWWYGKNYQQIALEEAITLSNNIHNKKAGSMVSFDTFLEKQNQKSVDELLNQLTSSPDNIDFLNQRFLGLEFGLKIGVKVNRIIARKIVHWAQENMLKLFTPNFTITPDFFLITLLNIDYTYLDKELIAVIHDNFDYIQQQPTGAQFLTLLQKQHQDIYNAIMQREQKVKGILKEGMQKSLEELRAKE